MAPMPRGVEPLVSTTVTNATLHNQDFIDNLDLRIGDTVLDNTPSGFALFQAIGGHYTSPAQAIEELVDNAISSIRANGGSGKVILRHTGALASSFDSFS